MLQIMSESIDLDSLIANIIKNDSNICILCAYVHAYNNNSSNNYYYYYLVFWNRVSGQYVSFEVIVMSRLASNLVTPTLASWILGLCIHHNAQVLSMLWGYLTDTVPLPLSILVCIIRRIFYYKTAVSLWGI